MKKSIIAIVAVVALGCITGCGKNKNQVVCTGKATENGKTYEAKIVANLKNNKVNDGYIEMKFSDSKTADTMCSLFKLANSMADKESDKIDYSCKGKTVKINTLDMDEDEKFVGLTREEFIKKATKDSEDIKCK